MISAGIKDNSNVSTGFSRVRLPLNASIMKDEEKLILELCKKSADKSLISSVIQINSLHWQYFIDSIRKHKTAPYILERLLKYPVPSQSKKLLSDRCKREIAEALHNRKVIQKELARINAVFKHVGIEFILIKGLSLSYSNVRVMGDLDILVREEDLIRAVNELRKFNYLYVGHILNQLLNSKEKKDINLQLSWNNQFQLKNMKNGLLLELQTNLFERSRAYLENLDTLLDNIDFFWEHKTYNESLNCHEFSNDNLLLIMCLHCAIKRSPANNTFVLRTIIDIDNLIDNGVDWDSFIETSTKFNVANFVYFSLLLTQGLINTAIPEYVLDTLKGTCSKKQLFLTNVHLHCVNSLSRSSLVYSKLYKFFSPFIYGKSWKDRLKWILLIPVIFPPRKNMARYFGLKENSPLIYGTYLLNPFRWLYMIVSNIATHIEHQISGISKRKQSDST